jgi:hypothetical protein
MSITADELEIGTRVRNGIVYHFNAWGTDGWLTLEQVTLDQICRVTSHEWLRIPNFSKKSLRELQAALAKFGYRITDDGKDEQGAFSRAVSAARHAITARAD